MKTILISIFLIASVSCQIDFSERVRDLSIELLHHTQSETGGHVVISPFGVWSLMMGITVGASGDSRTQLIQAFKLIKEPTTLAERYKELTGAVLDAKTTFKGTNVMFLDERFKILPDFRNTITNEFGATVEILDFKDSDAQMKMIAVYKNKLVLEKEEENSFGLSIVPMSSNFSAKRMAFINVITFQGLWTTPFNETDTTVEPFYDEEKNEIGKVNMMSLRARVAFSNIKEINSLILELPFRGDDDEKYTMLIILPYPKIKVSEVNQNLQFVSFPEMFAKLQRDIDTYGLDEISVKLPRFKISTKMDLDYMLYVMGVVDIFKPGLANFQGMTNEDVYLSAITHNAKIEVTEKGTVASAATSADSTDRTLPPYYHVNRPFLYFVMHKPTATTIFSGIYSKPSLY